MTELTLLFFLLAFGVFLIACFKKVMGVRYLSVIMSIVSLFTTLTDDTMSDDGWYLLMIVNFFLLIMSGLYVVMDASGKWQ